MQEKYYDKSHCWQYDIRLNNRNEDIAEAGLSIEIINSLRCSDFTIQHEEKKLIFTEVKQFIERHEWLGKISLHPTHFFTARYKGMLAGIIIMDMPVAFSKMLGHNTKDIEKLISRGACISWSPKNLASNLLMFAIKWMVANTQFRLFVAYSDTEAKELGTIYQACNFYYLGRKAGACWQYKLADGKLVSDRHFRSRSVYKRLAKAKGIFWDASWQTGDSIHFDKMPVEIAKEIKQLSKDYQNSCEKRLVVPKHKYAYILGIDKRETKKLRKLFLKKNDTFEYPKDRVLANEKVEIKFAPALLNNFNLFEQTNTFQELDMFD